MGKVQLYASAYHLNLREIKKRRLQIWLTGFWGASFAGGIPSNYRMYAVTPDNRRFLMIETDEKIDPNRLNVVLDCNCNNSLYSGCYITGREGLVRMQGKSYENYLKQVPLIPGTEKKTRSTGSDKLKVGITLRNLTTRRFFFNLRHDYLKGKPWVNEIF